MPPDARKTITHLKWILAGMLVVFSTLLYDPTRLENTSGDSISHRYWPVAILKHGTYTLNPFKQDLDGVAFAALYIGNGDWLPRVTFGMGLFTIPFYAVADWFDIGGTVWTHDRICSVSRWNAIFLAVWSVVALFLLLIKFAPIWPSYISTLLFAFGTWNWSLGAQGLSWQTAAVLCLILNMHLLWRLCTSTNKAKLTVYAALFGLLHAVIWSTRPSNIFMLLPCVLVLQSQRLLLAYSLSLASVLVPLICVHQKIYWSPLGFYGMLLRITYDQGSAGVWKLTFFEGLAGLLFSPNRGTMVFFPLLLLVPLLWVRLMPPLRIRETFADIKRFRIPSWNHSPRSKQGLSAGGGIPESFGQVLAWGTFFYFVSICNLDFWHSTWSYGPRYLYDLQPLVWPSITLAIVEISGQWRRKPARSERKRLPRWAAPAFGLCALIGIAVHALGHYNYDLWVWNSRGGQVNWKRAWDFKDFMLTEVWKAGSNKNRWSSAMDRLKKYGF